MITLTVVRVMMWLKFLLITLFVNKPQYSASLTNLNVISSLASKNFDMNLNIPLLKMRPEPRNWYAGDMHVHLNCGDDSVVQEDQLLNMMETNDLSIVSVLADMGNGEVKNAENDLKKVNGKDADQSTSNHIIHWDAEWHWDASYSQFNKQALGGHLVLLGLKKAEQIWTESPYKILEWARKQHAIGGFAHFQYLNDTIQNDLNCCIPIDYPVEAALGTIDFISQDVYHSDFTGSGPFSSSAVINAYYKLLNCGFRLALVAGTDYPCNGQKSLGNMLTYVEVEGKLTYDKWIQGIKNGRTVVSRNGHDEFLELSLNNQYTPGDEIALKSEDQVEINIKWTSVEEMSGSIELISNGKVLARQQGTAKPGEPMFLRTAEQFTESSWVCARRMSSRGHQTHTAPVYISIDRKPVRASAEDARFFISWIDNILNNIEPGRDWRRYFPEDLATVTERYKKAREIYRTIAAESELVKK